MMQAIADVSRLVQDWASAEERWWLTCGPTLLGDELGSAVVETRYIPLRFRLPGGWYTPDYLHILETGRMIFIEVKGSRQQRNYRDARSKLRAAAEWYPFFAWYEVRINPRTEHFELEEIT